MTRKRKRAAGLTRLAVLSWSPADLRKFTQAVDRICIVTDLMESLLTRLEAQSRKRTKPLPIEIAREIISSANSDSACLPDSSGLMQEGPRDEKP
jgi:hypothetical protein